MCIRDRGRPFIVKRSQLAVPEIQHKKPFPHRAASVCFRKKQYVFAGQIPVDEHGFLFQSLFGGSFHFRLERIGKRFPPGAAAGIPVKHMGYAGGRCFCRCRFRPNAPSEGFQPVSYTHLDVYKRQMEEMRKQAQLIKYSSIVVSTVPMLVLYPFLQKYFVKGIMVGSLKG